MEPYIVITALVGMVFMLVKGYLRPGIILFSVVVLFVCCGIITPTEAISGFSNKGVITVGLLFLVSEGIRCSHALKPIMARIFPSKHRSTIKSGYRSILPTVASISAFLNNTPIVVIFIPQIRAWCQSVGLPIKKFLIPLSYAAILGGMCTLIGTSTNLVVHGLMLDAGLSGFTMFELGKVGVIIALVGMGYITIFGARRLPNDTQAESLDSYDIAIEEDSHKVAKWRQWLSLTLLIIMVFGATLSQMPFAKQHPAMANLDMFFWAAVVAIIMAVCNIFPAKGYTKFISWDILITIASALAISRAMTASGLADAIAAWLIGLSDDVCPYIILALLYLTTNCITEIITNNAAAAFAFPIALSAATQLGVSPMPFCVAISIAASASFCSPIGYQTNMIVQGLGGYKFGDFVKIGLPLSILTFVISMIFIPIFWRF